MPLKRHLPARRGGRVVDHDRRDVRRRVRSLAVDERCVLTAQLLHAAPLDRAVPALFQTGARGHDRRTVAQRRSVEQRRALLRRALAQVDDDQLAVGDDQRVLALVAVAGVASPADPASATSGGRTPSRRRDRWRRRSRRGRATRRAAPGRRRRPTPSRRYSSPKRAKSRAVAYTYDEPMNVPASSKRGRRAGHPGRAEQPVAQQRRLHRGHARAGHRGVADDPGDDVRRPAGVVPHGARRVLRGAARRRRRPCRRARRRTASRCSCCIDRRRRSPRRTPARSASPAGRAG